MYANRHWIWLPQLQKPTHLINIYIYFFFNLIKCYLFYANRIWMTHLQKLTHLIILFFIFFILCKSNLNDTPSKTNPSNNFFFFFFFLCKSSLNDTPSKTNPSNKYIYIFFNFIKLYLFYANRIWMTHLQKLTHLINIYIFFI